MNRREFLAASTLTAAGAALVPSVSAKAGLQPPAGDGGAPQPGAAKTPRFKHSVCRWCYSRMSVDELAKGAAAIGLNGIDLLDPPEWAIAKKYGLQCSLGANLPSNPIPKGFNRVENHDAIIKELEERLPLCKDANVPSQIVFSGNRGGMDDKEGLKNCVTGLKRITPLAEKLGVTVVMELLNSRVDHHDYMCDKSAWGFELVKQVGSPRFKMLYDIYHMQIMDGDIIRTVTKNKDLIGHYHTGGVPGRNEIDQTQELNYRTICEAIADHGYTGYLAQEFIPKHDPLTSLKQAFETCCV